MITKSAIKTASLLRHFSSGAAEMAMTSDVRAKIDPLRK
jgi:hypothetical protein